MNGVTILAMENILKYPSWGLPVIFGVLVAAIVIGLIVSVVKKDGFYFCISFLIGLFLMLISGIIVEENKIPSSEYEYKVIIEENVNFNEFYNKYEVIDQEGKIYTIKEKQN